MPLALATCEESLVPDRDAERLIPALDERSGRAELVAWTDPDADWSSYELVLLSSTWDYHERLDEFLAWLRRAADATRVENPPELVEWNVDKRYLRELEGDGIPIVPTAWAEPASEGAAVREAVSKGWRDLVVKPAVDLGASRLRHVDQLALRPALSEIAETAMVQPFLPSLQQEGELSLIYLGGELSHAVRKQPAAGEFRVQEHYGGRYEAVEAPDDALAVAERTMEFVARRFGRAEPLLYGRVDLVRDLRGSLCVAELELIEPSLYLHVVEQEATERLAELLLAAVRLRA